MAALIARLSLLLALGLAPAGATSLATGEANAADCREVTHAAGVSCVPLEPQRIVVLDATTALPTIIDLGGRVVGSVVAYEGNTRFPDYVPAEALEGVEIVGATMELSLEAVIALNPDVIIGDDYFAGSHYEELSRVAPTVIIPYPWYRPDWYDSARIVAQTIGRESEFDARLAGLRQDIAAVAARFAGEGRKPVLSRVDIWQGQPMYHHFDCTWFGPMLHDMGITQPAAQQGACDPAEPYSAFVTVSQEQLPEFFSGGDALVVYQHDPGPLDVILAGWPAWTRVDAVAAGKVFYASDAWGVGTSISAARRIVSDIDTLIFPPRP